MTNTTVYLHIYINVSVYLTIVVLAPPRFCISSSWPAFVQLPTIKEDKVVLEILFKAEWFTYVSLSLAEYVVEELEAPVALIPRPNIFHLKSKCSNHATP